MPTDDNKQALYNNLIKSGRVTENEIGTYDTFSANMADSANVSKLYQGLRKNDLFKEDELGTYDTFYKNVGTPQSGQPVQQGQQPQGKMSFAEWKDSPQYSEGSSYDDYIKGESATPETSFSQLAPKDKQSNTPILDWAKKQGVTDDQLAQISNQPIEDVAKVFKTDVPTATNLVNQYKKEKALTTPSEPKQDKPIFPSFTETAIQRPETKTPIDNKTDVAQTQMKLAQAYYNKGDKDNAVKILDQVKNFPAIFFKI